MQRAWLDKLEPEAGGHERRLIRTVHLLVRRERRDPIRFQVRSIRLHSLGKTHWGRNVMFVGRSCPVKVAIRASALWQAGFPQGGTGRRIGGIKYLSKDRVLEFGGRSFGAQRHPFCPADNLF